MECSNAPVLDYKLRSKLNWSQQEDDLLLYYVDVYGKRNWKTITAKLGSKNRIQCFHRYKRIKTDINYSHWTEEEDEKVKELVSKFGNSWVKIAEELKTRTSNQIRERYINILSERINRGKFTEEEDNMLLELFLKYGKQWSKISKSFKNRSADKIKSRFYTKTLKDLKIKYPEVYKILQENKYSFLMKKQQLSNTNHSDNQDNNMSSQDLHTKKQYFKITHVKKIKSFDTTNFDSKEGISKDLSMKSIGKDFI